MDSSNRQVDGAVESDDGQVRVSVTDRVALLTGLKKVDIGELTPEEWVQLINIALVHAKPHFKYIPLFGPVSAQKVKRFSFQRRFYGIVGDVYEGEWYDEPLSIPMTSGSLAAFRQDAKVIQVYQEMTFTNNGNDCTKIMLTTKGVFICLRCRRANKTSTWQAHDIEIISDDKNLEKLIALYSPIGHLSLFAISAMMVDTYDDKMKTLETLAYSGAQVQGMCNNIQLDGTPFFQPGLGPRPR